VNDHYPETRPKLADFAGRKNERFSFTCRNGKGSSHWILKIVEAITPPDTDELRELECFCLVFKAQSGAMVNQGLFLVEDGKGFSCDLFATPCSPSELSVIIN